VSLPSVDQFFMHALFGMVLVAIIVPLAIIDLNRMVLPDKLNLLLAGFGFAHSLVLGNPSLIDAMLGAIASAACLKLVMIVYRQLRSVDGLGRGDYKFVSAAGLWIGWQGLPLMLLVASVSALLAIFVSALRRRNLNRFAMVPFGPFLGLGTISAWLVLVAS
jgi:leader peptidase (prepilin peptidase)/N-methyltransferase